MESFSAFCAFCALYASLGRSRLRIYVEIRNTKRGEGSTMELQSGRARSSRLGKQLDPALKSWMDNVIIPARWGVSGRC